MLQSRREVRPGFEAAGPADPALPMRLAVVLKPHQPLPEAEWAGAPWNRLRPSYEEHVARHGARGRDIRDVVAFAEATQLEVVRTSAAARTVILRGSVAAVGDAFQTALLLYRSTLSEESYVGYSGHLQLPHSWHDIVVAVAGVDQRRMAERRGPVPRREPALPFTLPELAAIYGFPPCLTAAGQSIGLLQFLGGYRAAAVEHYFGSLGVAPVLREVDAGWHNDPGKGLNLEPTMDVEIAGALAPRATIVSYFAEPSEEGWIEALGCALHGEDRPSVLSISWGYTEFAPNGMPTWTPAVMAAVDLFFLEAAVLGVTVFVAAGDNGSSDGQPGPEPHVRYPASSRFVIACGGTTLSVKRGVRRETVWNDAAGGGVTGGGASAYFDRPGWQQYVLVPPAGNGLDGRGIPDVAADADFRTGYRLYREDDPDWISGGTSAVAPLYAGLIARINQQLAALYGPRMTVGYLTPWLYDGAGASPAFHDVTRGTNGAYRARRGWDPCTGWGTPDGTALMNALIDAVR